jgi:catechol 2,3-dioxygenase-like lactoylglutathione lyase family enzyme
MGHGCDIDAVGEKGDSEMIQAAHVVLSSHEPERLRVFFRDVLGFPSVDAGGGWLIFALPTVELAVHPEDGMARHQLYLMCDDLAATMKELTAKGVEFTQPVKELRWGRLAAFRLPDGEELYLYEPKHASPLAGVGEKGGK